MKEQIALINSLGEIQQWFSPATTEGYLDNGVTAEGLTIKIMDESLDLVSFSKTNVYLNGSWVTRAPRPGDYYVWNGTDWVLDTVSFNTRIRRDRDARLFGCDWTQAADSPLSAQKKEEWRIYRQALRDFPSINEATRIEDLVWPTEPQ